MERLYFVAALSDLDLERCFWEMKDEMARKAGSVKGLKVLPHITEISPFKRSEDDENKIIDQLHSLIGSFSPLEINFDGFGYFENPKSHTIYVRVKNDPVLQEQHKQLNLHARNRWGLAPKQTPLKFTPHMTLAYRDLDKQKFDYAWPEYSNRKFEEKMMLQSLWLLKYDGLCWIPYEEFSFNGKTNNRLFD